MNVLEKELGEKEILGFLPHRDPFVFVDKVVSVDTPSPHSDHFPDHVGSVVTAIKFVRSEEPHFKGHFPDYPIMPGVLIIEALAQAASFSLYPLIRKSDKTVEESPELFLVSVNRCRFRKPVVPGDELKLQATLKRGKAGLWSFDCVASVQDKKVAEAEVMAKLQLKKA